jgi:hypothetical protein
VFIDRTFSSIAAVAHWTFGGKFIECVFKVLTRWNDECWINFRESGKNGMEGGGGYKLMGCDPEDKVITELSSLRSSVSRDIVR